MPEDKLGPRLGEFVTAYVNQDFRNMQELADRFGVDHSTLFNWLNRPTVRKEIDKAQQEMVNQARAVIRRGVRMCALKMLEKAQQGDIRAMENILEYSQIINREVNIFNQNIQQGAIIDNSEPSAEEIATIERLIKDYKKESTDNRRISD